MRPVRDARDAQVMFDPVSALIGYFLAYFMMVCATATSADPGND